MRLTRAGEYAVRCALYLSIQPSGAVVSRREIARNMDIPMPFLGKIAQQMARSGIMEILQGSKGGFRLLVTPKDLSLLDVVEAVMGEIFLNDCLMNPRSCARNRTCAVNKVWMRARDQLRASLRRATFDTMIREETCFTPLQEIEFAAEEPA